MALLLIASARIDIPDAAHKTAREYVQEQNNEAIKTLFLENMLDDVLLQL